MNIEELKRRLKTLREANPREVAEYGQSYRRAADYMLANADALVARLEAAQIENERLRCALRYYARGYHFQRGNSDAWDTVSGEPQNFWCDEAGTATVEDGSMAAHALRNNIEWDAEESVPIEGEKPSVPLESALMPSTRSSHD